MMEVLLEKGDDENIKAFKINAWSFVMDYTTEALTMHILLFVGLKTAKDLLKDED